eukprot:COSAG04_NODE_18427_length_442_cov_0.600583_1_plen_81_part_01
MLRRLSAHLSHPASPCAATTTTTEVGTPTPRADGAFHVTVRDVSSATERRVQVHPTDSVDMLKARVGAGCELALATDSGDD